MFKTEFDVRFYETDALGHVSNTVLVQWFEAGRIDLFKVLNPEMNLHKWPIILASYKVDFLRQLFMGSPVQVHTYISRIGNSSFDAYQEVWQNGEKCASGTTVLVHYDFTEQKPKSLSDEHKAELAKHGYEEAQ